MEFSNLKEFKSTQLADDQVKGLKKISAKVRCDILKMINSSGSGHPGGSLSSADIYLMLWLCTDSDKNEDKVIVSHGHTSAAVYSVLGNLGYFNITDAIDGFRKRDGKYEGHPSYKVPGVEWCSGSLGQGLSVGCGYAMASKMKNKKSHVFVVMGDGEQTKGQITEAREFAVKYGLNNLTAIVDFNKAQASGRMEEIMPQNIAAKYKASGWNVIETDGHSYSALYESLKKSYEKSSGPTMILAHTIMGKGVTSIEDDYRYHGSLLDEEQYNLAMNELAGGPECGYLGYTGICKSGKSYPKIKINTDFFFDAGSLVDCRSSFGKALVDITDLNKDNDKFGIAAIDCDLKASVKLTEFAGKYPESFIECGIQENNAASIAGAMSKSEIITFFADFGVFGIDEVYSQLRMNDINAAPLKLILTHCGLDVGEDGKTHQCIDYISILSNLFGFKLIVPGDANQTYKAVGFAAKDSGGVAIAMGRSKIPILTKEDGLAYYDDCYDFEYGRADWIREGTGGTIITCGTLVNSAVEAHDKLLGKGIGVGVLNLSCPLEPDVENILRAAATGTIVTYEDHNVRSGIGSIIGTILAENNVNCIFKRIGIKEYGTSANPAHQYIRQGMDVDSLLEIFIKKN